MRAASLALIGAVTAGFAALAWHRRWISDDGLIVVRTVRELLAGNGPVYNAFERAEPNTSTLWTYLLAAIGWISGRSLARLATELGWLFAVAGVAIAMDATRRWHRARGEAGLLAPAGVLIVLGASPFWDFATSGRTSGSSRWRSWRRAG
jgi:arabinofuranosyltransferase